MNISIRVMEDGKKRNCFMGCLGDRNDMFWDCFVM